MNKQTDVNKTNRSPNVNGYHYERTADEFVARFGFNRHSVSFDLKAAKYSEYVRRTGVTVVNYSRSSRNSRILHALCKFTGGNGYIISTITKDLFADYDSHHTGIRRIDQNIRDMADNFKNPAIPLKLRQSLLVEIDEMREMRKEFNKLNSEQLRRSMQIINNCSIAFVKRSALALLTDGNRKLIVELLDSLNHLLSNEVSEYSVRISKHF